MAEVIEQIILVRVRPQALQDLCLQVIASNFNEVLSTSTERNIDFLRRRSQLLLKKFKGLEYYVFLDHAFFCLNRHLKKLDFYWFKAWNIPAVVNQLATVENTLAVLSVSLLAKTDISLDVLWQLIRLLPETLESLSLRFTNCTDSMLKTVSKRCPGLRELYLDKCDSIHDMGVMALCSKNEKGDLCPNQILQKLDLTSTKVTENCLEIILKNFPNLTQLRHSDLDKVLCKMYGEASLNDGLSKKYNLKCLHLKSESSLDYHDLKPFTTLCPYVTKLTISVLSQVMLKSCEEFILLNDVDFTVCESCDLSPFFKARGRALKSLTISHMGNIFPYGKYDFPISMVTLVKSCPRLQYLNLKWPRFAETKSEWNSQHALHYLTNVEIYVNCVENLEHSLSYLLSQSPNLEEFILQNAFQFDYPSYVLSALKYVSMSTLNQLVLQSVNVDFNQLMATMPNFYIKLLEF